MKNIYHILKTNLVLLAIFSFTTVSFAIEKNKNIDIPKNRTERNHSLIANDLSKKLKLELAENNLSVKLKNIEESTLTNEQVLIKGQAFCVLPTENTELPLVFEAMINPVNQTVSDVKYTFVESEFAPAGNEETLMKELLGKIRNDYKTEQITIAIDGFDMKNAANNNKILSGIGEVKINEMGWRKISFDVTMNNKNSAEKIAYKISQ